MRIQTLLPVLLLLTTAVTPAWTQEGPPKPGPEQAKLKESVGRWSATIRMGDDTSKGECVRRMELNDFFLIDEFTADFGGMKFQGRGQTGYCPIRKKYIATWIDNMTPSPVVMMGTFDASGKELTMMGEAPTMEGTLGKFKAVTRTVDADTQTYTMYQTGSDGSEQKLMTIEYKRQK
jgi:hypothetical protein